mgnify:CR=1 FL=1
MRRHPMRQDRRQDQLEHGPARASDDHLGATPAAQARRVIGIEGTYAFGWGPRAAHARRDLAAAFGAENLPTLPKRAWT